MLPISFMQSYPDLPIITLSPGQLLISAQASIVSTILGSCISLCLHSEKMRIGAICHGILPRQSKLPIPGHFPYLDTAVPHMLETMRSRFGLTPSELTVKLFGGASVLQPRTTAAHGPAIGQQNIAATLEALTRFGLAPHVQKTGGTEGYKIFFNTATGEVFVRRLPHNSAKSCAQMKERQATQ
ncbi:chemotaxis protein CheD [Thiovibrio frasassiensis]|uniref:Probable chemoreceptor glutamine deamidase CheD n=1 Tax=Thiovibrio frasassiensis TaxID=2984131 RepID=A0A9X4MFM8_9BACT|nr:chemotaxis protein CheD [Thiovibrio frasassiensis]MDG4474613.1 chemotaxis protein CheD [Thiovibrio frasassiensis]